MAVVEGSVGFLGGGMMASALMGGFARANAVRGQLRVSEPYAPQREKLAAAGYLATTDNIEVARHCDILWLAVKPDVIGTVLGEISTKVPELDMRSKLVVSIAAGVSVDTLEQALPAGARVVRVMPNLPCLVGECAAGFTRGHAATDADADAVRALLNCVGRAEEVPEKLMDAVTGVSGSGPAYAFLMIEALADGGVRAGLPRAVAMSLAAQTLKGAAEMVIQTGTHPATLKDQVCSPGGTTIAGVEALEKASFRAAAMGAVAAAAKRSAELRALAEKK